MLGVGGNQPAIAGVVQTTPEERLIIGRSIMQQKIGANPKALKAYSELKQRQQDAKAVEESTQDRSEESSLVKIAKIAMTTTVRWSRKKADRRTQQSTEEEGPTSNVQRYASRMIKCTRCDKQQETKQMQLRTKDGYRALHCKGCGKQERSLFNVCQCGTIWHQCEVHRTDPSYHLSRKPVVRKKKARVTTVSSSAPKGQHREPCRGMYAKTLSGTCTKMIATTILLDTPPLQC